MQKNTTSINAMKNKKLISFDLKADFGFFKKPDYNDGLLLSYNLLHKPALLGVLGAISGFKGHQKKGELPEYYIKLSDLLVSIMPLNHEKGIFQKSSVKYINSVGYANSDGNLIIEETILLKPSYRCYLLIDIGNPDHQRLEEALENNEAAFIPYLGKNEYQAWQDGQPKEYTFEPAKSETDFSIGSIFTKTIKLKESKAEESYSFELGSMLNSGSYCYFEKLPIGFNKRLAQYEYADFVYTDWKLKPGARLNNLFHISTENESLIIQLH